jgi:hypothetical protein
MDDYGRRTRGLQNRLRALLMPPGWVRFAPIPASALEKKRRYISCRRKTSQLAAKATTTKPALVITGQAHPDGDC